MQSVSPSGRFQLDGGQALGRVRESLGGGKVWSFLLVLLITLTVADSTSTFHWMNGIEVVVPIALLGAALWGALAITPIPEWIAFVIGVVVALPVAVLGAWPQIHLAHPNAEFGLQLFNLWGAGIKDGSLATDSSFYLLLICLLMWVTGAWLSWCVLRWRKPMLGLIPGAAAFATNALNVLPGMADQNGFAFALIVLIIALLLWNNYATSVTSAVRARVKLTGDAKWDFWESGIVAMLIVVVLSIFLPQMSKTDRTIEVESGIFTGWAQLQSEISHPGFISQGAGGGTTGFSEDVKLVGSISRNTAIVFVYQKSGTYGGPVYFRGLDITKQANGEWRYEAGAQKFTVDSGKPITYGESYDALGVAAFTIKMDHAPSGYSSVLFYPGQLLKVDRAGTAHEVPLSIFTPSLMSLDRLDLQQPGGSASYIVYSEYSGATAAQLEEAGTDYPDWVKPFAVIPVSTYRAPVVLEKVQQLALSVTAPYSNPYDKATAIENFLRSDEYKYDLNAPTDNRFDSLDYFLFHSKIGYCEYFATAMGDMLRSLGIPTRLVNGYGQGRFDPALNSYVVRSDDAHTWVEAYFPGYGWIPFEPTPDNNYPPISRGLDPSNVCFREAGCDSPDTTNIPIVGSTGGQTPGAHPKSTTGSGSGRGGFSIGSLLGPSLFTESLAAGLAIVLILLLIAVRYLRPRTVMAVWKRMLMLASLAGAERRPGETPLELGRRLQRSFPEAAEPVAALTSGFAVAAYAPADDAVGARASVMEAWTALRPHLLRRVFARLRLRTP